MPRLECLKRSISLAVGNGAPTARAQPIEQCALDPATGPLGDCGPCLNQEVKFLNAEALNGKIVLVVEDDFPCFHSWIQFTDAAEATGGLALVIFLSSNDPNTLSSHGTSTEYRATIPSFTLGAACVDEVTAYEVENPGAAARILLPDIEDGTANRGPAPRTQLAQILIKQPEEARGVLEVAQVSWGDINTSAVEALAVVLEAASECMSADTCVDCERLRSDGAEFANGGSIEGRIAIFFVAEGVCLSPLSTVARSAQRKGAAGVLLVNAMDNPDLFLSYSESTEDISIPTFTIPYELGSVLRPLITSGSLILHLPAIVDGTATTNAFQGEDCESCETIGREDIEQIVASFGMKVVKETGGIDTRLALGLAIPICLLVAAVGAYGGYRYRRYRKERRYHLVDHGIQAGVPGNWTNIVVRQGSALEWKHS
eukprot:scaffold1542_cov402-Prasinococcus_capsulatus_cf.AAC.4